MAPRKKATASSVARIWWLAHPDGTHGDCIAHLIAKGYRSKGSESLKKISHQAKFLLNQSENGLSKLTIARRNKTHAKNAAAKKRKATLEANGTGGHRHPRERDDTPHLRTYWAAHLEDGNHDDAMQRCKDADVDTCIAHSYQVRSKVRAGGYANGNGNGAVAATPAATAPVEFDATDTAENGSVAELMAQAGTYIVEAAALKSSDPIEVPARLVKAKEAIELSLKGMAVAMANA